MKNLMFFAALSMAFAASAQTEILDLSKATTPLEFNSETGAWTETTNMSVTALESQCFSFIKGATEYQTWWGFTASNSANNKLQTPDYVYQYSNMAMGGIALNEDGTVKKSESGAPVVSTEMPYLVAYYDTYSSTRPIALTFNDGKAHSAISAYINLNSYAYYSVEQGNGFAHAFADGDKFTLTIHGVSPDNTEKTIEVSLASFTNGDLTINRGWKYVDLSSLGNVNEIYFTLTSTDTGDFGMNTPGYFCLDKLAVGPATADAAIATVAAGNRPEISYNRASAVASAPGAEFIAVYDVAGNMIASATDSAISLDSLPAGIYLVKAGSAALKVAR